MRNPRAPLVLVTGAPGFIGTALTKGLLAKGYGVRMTGQVTSTELETLGAEWFPLGDLQGEVDWTAALAGVQAVVHLAGLAHRFESVDAESWKLYDQVNHLATRSLARCLQGHPTAKRFVFASTVRVHGDIETMPVREDSPLVPVTPYDASKADAEEAIRELLDPSRLKWVILRPVVVYGPGNRGNMSRLEGLLRRGLPVPVATVPNRRSFLFIGNLVDAILTYLGAEDPPSGHAWLLADQAVTSTEELVRAMGRAMGIRPRIIRVMPGVLRGSAGIGTFLGRLRIPFPWNEETRRKLLGDFYVEPSVVQRQLGWEPPFTGEEGISQTFRPTKAHR
jgi:nucleoside-diphosphate-sugar epimerase